MSNSSRAELNSDDGSEIDAKTPTAEDIADVERERDSIREFVAGLNFVDIKNGNWFPRLLATSLTSYAEKVDAKYFQDKYQGVPPDAIVDQRIKMAARYAAIEGGLSASAYTATVAATIGTVGGSSPATVPMGIATVMVDIAYLSQLQLKLAYDIAVLYGVPLDVDDPEDLWKLIRVAFTVKSGEFVREGVNKAVPALMRPLIKRFYSGAVLNAARGLPVVGKFLLQRNLIKIGIPVVGIPLAVVLNRGTTVVAGKHAQSVFRNEARVLEVAKRLMDRSRHPQLLLWVAWLVINADGRISDDEALLIRHLIRFARERHEIADERLTSVVDLDPDDVWLLLSETDGEISDVLDASVVIAEIDGGINSKERKVIDELSGRSSGRQAT
ncbi:tellurite resistance protein [Neomicrococcus aestuarii]|uniref:Tellurite resistance protein n=1 Tax=Neomicrococcus aestuarii TaxID=556325 RepID=A0A7W8X099_9MICC|nr:hypothetical protein [Neomicrococcus aestuarii]MBB5512658.1 tellurite resistance protein [Neomicrococcus aestuarii]